MKTISEYVLGDMLARYIRDDAGHAGLLLIPAGMRDCVLEKEMAVAPLAEVHFRGDSLPHGYANGQSLAGTRSSAGLIFRDQRREGNRIVTELSDPEGRTILHDLSWQEGSPALRCSTRFENRSSRPVTLELLSSMNLGGITPFTPGDAAGFLNIFRARSNWSAEGRLTCESAESLSLEPSWTHHAVRVEKFGQIGSMPVRHYFPFLAVRDESAGVTWAFQLACPSSWQFELRRQDDGLTVLAGLADFDFGHWAKTLQPGEGITSPEAYLTVSRDGVDRTSQRLLSLHREQWARRGEPLPVIFNEYCTTWGNPSHENLSGIISCLKGKDIDYLVIDAGWYLKEGAGWSDCSGDWIPSRTLFPRGIDAVAREIREAGMKPGLWFEAETCAAKSDLFSRTELLLTRDGAVLDTENRRFLDLRKPEAQAYLDERVISTLKENGFAYVKIDYNDTIGTGCDDPDSLGEGLRQNMLAAQDFFRRMSARYADRRHVLYELCNEPNGAGVTWPVVKGYAERVIPVIRENAPDAVILCGSPTWSQDVDLAAADPIGAKNLMYTLHFYAATHKDALRAKAEAALAAGAPVFISEFSICDASGDGMIDYESAAAWRALIEKHNLSYFAWSLSNRDESAALIRAACQKTADFDEGDLTDTGRWLRAMLIDHRSAEAGR